MIIANIELSENEDYSPFHSKRYGGGSVFGKYALPLLNNQSNKFHVYGRTKNFENVTAEEGKANCFELTDQQIDLLKKGYLVSKIIPESSEWDILIHNQESFAFNTQGLKCKQVCWLAFVNQTIWPLNHAGLVYSYDQNPIADPNRTKLFKVQIGTFVPPVFEEYKKEDYLFQVTRMDSTMNPIKTVKLCNKFNIKGYFAGPILNDYPLLEYIDNKNTFYMGILTEQEKIKMIKGARLFGGIQDWDTIWNLSCHQSLAYNTPVVCYKRGFFKELISDGIDGFYYNDDEKSFLNIWEKSNSINQKDCHDKALKYSEKEMVNSFFEVFKLLINNK